MSTVPTPEPLEQYNKYSCGLASVVYEASKAGFAGTQDEVVAEFADHFPQWEHHPGMLRPYELLHLTSLLGYQVDDFLATTDLVEAKEVLNARGAFAAFYTVRFWPSGDGGYRQTDHAMALTTLDSDRLVVMNPATAFFEDIDQEGHFGRCGIVTLCLNPMPDTHPSQLSAN